MQDSITNCKIQALSSFSTKEANVEILRLDLFHPVVSGNKWFKLRFYLEEALASDKKTIATFGGAYSNHIVATAFAARGAALDSVGFIRGERPAALSDTLKHAMDLGMQLEFINRDSYRQKEKIVAVYNRHDFYWIMEGGYGALGAKGAATILDTADTKTYTHIICAVGTGTMLAGLIKGAQPNQQVVGISVLKDHIGLTEEVIRLLDDDDQKPLILHDHHFGGYAKHPPELLDFMRETWKLEKLPTDIVYTSKMLFAVKQLVAAGYFPTGSNLLLIHSGGLQGNQSLPPDTLPF